LAHSPSFSKKLFLENSKWLTISIWQIFGQKFMIFGSKTAEKSAY
jgi:hypothetical protein